MPFLLYKLILYFLSVCSPVTINHTSTPCTRDDPSIHSNRPRHPLQTSFQEHHTPVLRLPAPPSHTTWGTSDEGHRTEGHEQEEEL
jgi:hypothetical protein